MKFTTSKRRQVFMLWCLLWVLFAILLVHPISYGIMRLSTLLLGGLIGLTALWLFWQKKFVRYVCLCLAFGVIIPIIGPDRPVDRDALRDAYIRELIRYEGTPYLWGGENKFGIDCSGLVRQGLIQANWKMGIKSLNPGLLRQGFAMWWYDAGADALRDEYRNLTKRGDRAESINALNHNRLQKGDMAVTVDGEHILVYTGNLTWIEADPGYQKVIRVTVPEPHNSWFNLPVYVLRWQQLL